MSLEGSLRHDSYLTEQATVSARVRLAASSALARGAALPLVDTLPGFGHENARSNRFMLTAIRAWGDKLRRPYLFIYAVGLAAALVMNFVIWKHQNAVLRMEDPYGFSWFGQSIAEGRGLAQLNHHELPTMRRAPLYPGIIAVLYTLAGGPNTDLVRLLQCFAAGGTALFAFAIGKEMFSQRVGLLAGVMTAFHPMVVRYVPDIQVEALLTFFMTLMVWCGVRFLRAPTLLRGAALGAAGALGALVKGVLVVCLPIFALCWLVRQWRRKQPWRFPRSQPSRWQCAPRFCRGRRATTT